MTAGRDDDRSAPAVTPSQEEIARLRDPGRVRVVDSFVELLRPTSDVLDRLTRLAADLLGAASAQISMLGDEQTVVSIAGGEVGAPSPLEESLCTVTAVLGEPLVVADAGRDPRVAGLPPVTSGAVASYCGIPLRSAGGPIVGALCVYDAETRIFSARDVARLCELAESAMTEMELRRANHRLRDAVTRLDRIVGAAGLGSWEWRVGADRIVWDDQMYALFGIRPHEFGHRISEFLAQLHPDDRARTQAALTRACDELGDYDVEYRVRSGRGWRWIRAWGRAIAGDDGTAERVVGVASDTTAVRLERDLVARAVDHVTDVVFSLDHARVTTYANARMCELLGVTRDELVGRTLEEYMPPATRGRYESYLDEAQRAGATVRFEYVSEVVDHWWEARIQPTPEGFFVYLHDVSERKAVEQERAAMLLHHRTVADALQAVVLPDALPVVAGVGLAARYRPADVGVKVGGDWYDCFRFGPDRLLLAVGDVAGHGLPAAAVMGQLRNAVRAFALLGKGPARLLMRLNELMALHEPTALATVWIAELHLETGELLWSSAGHPPVIRSTARGAELLAGRPNPPLGARAGDAEWIEHRSRLDPGDVLLAYTDGLVERRGESITDGIDRLRVTTGRLAGPALEGVLSSIVDDLLAGRLVDDDVCALALRFEGRDRAV